jgi:hypothetical protein
VEYASIQFILEYIGNGKQIQSERLPFLIEEFLLNSDDTIKDNLVKSFISKEIRRILFKYAESFFSGSPNPNRRVMQFFYDSTQIGYELETFAFLFIAKYFFIKELIQVNYQFDSMVFFQNFLYNPNTIYGNISKMKCNIYYLMILLKL